MDMQVNNVEKRVRKVEDTVLLMHNDLKGIVQSIDKMAESMSRLADFGTKIRLLEERDEIRHRQHQEIERKLTERLDKLDALLDNVYTVATISVPNLDKAVTKLEQKVESHEKLLDSTCPMVNKDIEALSGRVKSLENIRNYVAKTVGGVILLALLGLIISGVG